MTNIKIPLKAVTVTYTRSLTATPTTEMFEDYEYYPNQEDFESLVINELFDKIHTDMGGPAPADPMLYTDVKQFETVEIDWESDEEEDEE